MVNYTISSQQKHNDLPELKARVDCRDIVRKFWGQPKSSTSKRDTYFSHWRNDGHKPSVSVTYDRIRDFGGIGASGDVYFFLERELNLTFPQAVEWVLDYTHSRPVNAPQRPRQERPAANEPPPANWQYAAINFTETAQRELFKNEAVLNYLRYERLLTDATIKAAGLGYNPQAHKVNGQYWVEAGIVIPRYQGDSLRLVNIRTVTGSFAAALGVDDYKRFNGDELDKYMCMAGSKLIGSLYHPAELTADRPLLFVEGEFDALLAWQEIGHIVQPVTLGGATNRLTPAQKEQLIALNVPIYIALDNDSAGQDAARHLLTEFGDQATAIQYPAGYKDFTDMLNAGMDAAAWFTAQASDCIFAEGAPASIVSALKTYTETGNPLLFVMAQDAARAGAIDPTYFKASDLFEWGWQNNYPVPKSSFYRFLEYEVDDLNELVPKCKALSLTPVGYKDNALQNGTNSRGKPSERYYRLSTKSELLKAISKQAGARLYDWEFKTDGKRGTKAQPRIAYLKSQGISNPAAVAAGLSKAYQPIYQRQRWAYRYAEKRIRDKHAAIVASLADLTPIKTAGHLIKRQSDLDELIIQARLQPGQPVSLKQIAQWTGKHHTRVGQDLRALGYESQRSECRVIPIKPGQDIKRAALDAIPNGRWVGLKVDDNPEIQPFEQSIAARAKSVAMVIQPPNTYTFVGKPEPAERLEPTEKPAHKIDIEQSKAAPEYKPAPYFGDDVNPEVDYNQVVLGLTLSGWTYEKQSGFWIDPTEQHICRTMIEAVQLQAGIAIEPAPTVDSAPKQPEKRENSDSPYVESNEPVETPETPDFYMPIDPEWAGMEF